MKNTNWIWRTIAALLIIVLLVGGGIALYRLGYAHGIMAAQVEAGYAHPMFMRGGFDHEWYGGGRIMGNRETPLPFGQGVDKFRPAFAPGTPPVFFIMAVFLKLAFLVSVIWLIYKFISVLTGGRGWQLTFQKLPQEEKASKKKKK